MEAMIVVLLVVLAVIMIAMLGVAIFLTIKLIKLGRLVHSDLMPLKGKVAFWSSIIYTVFPLDLLPDPVYLDDIGVLVAAIVYVLKLAKTYGIAGGGVDAAGMPRRLPSTG